MANGTLAPSPKFTGLDDNGDPLVSGKLYTYAAGTTTPLATWPQVTLTPGQENANPIILDAGGRATIFLLPTSYKFILKTSADVTVWSQDNIGSVPSTNIDNDVVGTAGETLTATNVVYLNATTWSKADADAVATSTNPPIAFAVADTASAADGTFRLSGRMTGFSGLTPGADYYVSSTPGEITLTPPTNARYVGRADSIASIIITPNPRPRPVKSICNGRLTLTTGTPVTTADVTAAATLFFAPYQGNEIGLFTGTAWVSYAFAEVSTAAPTGANQVADVFFDYNDGAPVLAKTDWTNDTTRATALTTQDGILVKSGDTQQRYLGTVRTVTASQLNDSFALRHVWNNYNRVDRPCRNVLETANSWNYNTLTWRQANANAANQIDIVVGVAEDAIDVTVQALGLNNAGSAFYGVGIGADVTNASTSGGFFAQMNPVANTQAILTARYMTIPAVGRHFFAWVEIADTTTTTTFYGDNNSPTLYQSGIHGLWRA